ncbi:hypothetical protein D3C76_1185360 [compost metagenome]
MQDPGQRHQVGQLQPAGACQRVAGTGDHSHLLAAFEQFDVQVLAVALVWQAAHDHVEIAAQQRGQQGIAGAHFQRDTHFGVVALVGQYRLGQHARHRAHDAAHPYQAPCPARQLGNLRLGVLELVKRILRIADHHFAIQRRLHAPGQTLEQAYAKALLELLQQQAGRRLRGVHRRSGAAQVAELAQGIEQRDLAAGDLQCAEAGRRLGAVGWQARHIESGIAG